MNPDLVHGGALDYVSSRFPDAPRPWIDLSTGINPWPWPVTKINFESLQKLPTAANFSTCRNAMAASFGAPPSSVLPTPGSEIAIRLLPTVLNSRRVAVLAPSYEDHAKSWRESGAEVICRGDPLANAGDVDTIAICNPNNPDGRLFDIDMLEDVRADMARRGGWLIIDEAFADLNPLYSLAAKGGMDGLVILRSTGKFFGLAGLRVGAVIAPRRIREKLESLLGEWSVSSLSLAIAGNAYLDIPWQQETRRALKIASQDLDQLLASHAIAILGGTDLFRYVAVDDAHALWEYLCRRGIYVRRFGWTAQRLRVGLPADEMARLRLDEALRDFGLSRSPHDQLQNE